MVPDNIREIARRFFNNTATEEELTQLHQWYDTWVDEETIIPADTDDAGVIETRMLSRMLDQIRQKTGSPAPVVSLPKRTWRKVAVAAAVIMALGISLFLWQQKFAGNSGKGALAVTDNTVIQPGIDKAMLILADGREVALDSTATGVISKQGSTTIINQKGQLTYDGVNSQQDETTYYNTVKTGMGNQYMLLLPDGSKVWLNAASTLRFPTRFTAKERVVVLTGEGYFEVAKDKHHPFKVLLAGNTGEETPSAIEVLGTHFNIMAYRDEAGIKTTLLEGSVKVIHQISRSNDSTIDNITQTALLQPGQQALMPFEKSAYVRSSDKVIQVTPVNVEDAVAWKNGYFQFTDALITTVMRQAARWYNVEVVYNGNVQQEIFTGSIPRSAGINQFIKILELTKTVKVSIEGRKLIIAPY